MTSPTGDTALLERPVERPREREQPATGSGHLAHLVPKKDGKDGPTRVTEARVFGTPVTALCGHTWVPSRNPKSLPVCGTCKDLFESVPERGEYGDGEGIRHA